MGWNVWRLGIALSPLTRFLFFSSFRFCSSRFERSRVRTNFLETCDWINYAFSFFWNLLYIYIYVDSIQSLGATLLENLKLIVPLEFLFPLFKFKFSLDISLKIFHVYNFYNLEKGKICEKRYRPLWGETYRFSCQPFIIYTVYKNCYGSQIVERRGVAVVAVISPQVSIAAPTNFPTYRRKSCLVNSTKPPLSSPSSSNENLFIVSWWEVRIQNWGRTF